MPGYRYNAGAEQVFEYFHDGDAKAVGVDTEATSDDGSLKEALVRAAEHARDVQNVAVGTTMMVSHIEVVIGPNPPISQYKVVLSPRP